MWISIKKMRSGSEVPMLFLDSFILRLELIPLYFYLKKMQSIKTYRNKPPKLRRFYFLFLKTSPIIKNPPTKEDKKIDMYAVFSQTM